MLTWQTHGTLPTLHNPAKCTCNFQANNFIAVRRKAAPPSAKVQFLKSAGQGQHSSEKGEQNRALATLGQRDVQK